MGLLVTVRRGRHGQAPKRGRNMDVEAEEHFESVPTLRNGDVQAGTDDLVRENIPFDHVIEEKWLQTVAPASTVKKRA